MTRCFCPPERLVPRSETTVSSPCGKAATKSSSSAVAMALPEILLFHAGAEGDILPQRQVEDHAVLENKPDAPVQGFFVISVDGLAIIGDGSGGRLEKSDQQIKKLRLSRGGGADDGGFRSRSLW